jgi:hypothetical protein
MDAFRRFGTKSVLVIREGTASSPGTEATVEAHVQASKAFFAVDAPVFQGDVIEVADPRGGRARYRVRDVKVLDTGPAHMQHLEVDIAALAPDR